MAASIFNTSRSFHLVFSNGLKKKYFLGGQVYRTTKCKSSNIDIIKHEFQQQAVTFERDWSARSFLATDRIMKWAIENMRWEHGEKIYSGIELRKEFPGYCLDVACGTGIFARSLAKEFPEAYVVGLDGTKEMLEQAKITTELAKLKIQFLQGDAVALPFEENSFDLVVCRLAVHHFSQPQMVLKEMARVCKVGGRVVLVDIIAPHEATNDQNEWDRLENLRDPSHTKMLTVSGLERLLLGTEQLLLYEPTAEPLQNVMNLNKWMASTNTPPSNALEIVKKMEEELTAKTRTYFSGFQPFYLLGEQGQKEIHFIHNYVCVKAVKK